MEFLLEHKHLVNLLDLEHLISKYRSSGYVSSKMRAILDDVSGFPGFVDVLVDRCRELDLFFRRCRSELLDDILLEYFEDYYDYSISFGIYSYGVYSSSSVQIPISLESTDDRMGYLFGRILEKLWTESRSSFLSSEISRKERHEKNKRQDKRFAYWERPKNYFPLVGKLHPMVYVELKHKRYQDFYGDYSDESLLNISGYGARDFNVRWSQDTNLAKRMMARLNRFKLSFGAECTDIMIQRYHEPMRNWWDGERRHFVENPVISVGTLEIKFKL